MPIIYGVPRRPSSLRLKTLDYRTPGAYFVTFTVRRNGALLARISATELELTGAGLIVQAELAKLSARYPGVRVDEPMIMPDHVHLIVWIESTDSASLSTVIGGLKSASAYRINRLLGLNDPFWQSSFYDRFIRDERELEEIRQYIRMNPERWRIRHGLI